MAKEINNPSALEQARMQQDRWLTENKAGIDAHNARVAAYGVLIRPLWAQDEDGKIK